MYSASAKTSTSVSTLLTGGTLTVAGEQYINGYYSAITYNGYKAATYEYSEVTGTGTESATLSLASETPTPEPGSITLLLGGFALLGIGLRRSR